MLVRWIKRRRRNTTTEEDDEYTKSAYLVCRKRYKKEETGRPDANHHRLHDEMWKFVASFLDDTGRIMFRRVCKWWRSLVPRISLTKHRNLYNIALSDGHRNIMAMAAENGCKANLFAWNTIMEKYLTYKSEGRHKDPNSKLENLAKDVLNQLLSQMSSKGNFVNDLLMSIAKDAVLLGCPSLIEILLKKKDLRIGNGDSLTHYASCFNPSMLITLLNAGFPWIHYLSDNEDEECSVDLDGIYYLYEPLIRENNRLRLLASSQ
jgi:hypothetical protein